MNSPTLPLQGSCLCGAVQVNLTAPPLLTLACHCHDCQKLSASAYSLTAMFPFDCFSITGELEIGGLQSKGRAHYFCKSCMSFVFSRIKGAANRVNLRTSILDDAALFPPFVELMTDEKLAWSTVPAAHSFARYPETLQKLQRLMDDYSQHQLRYK